MYTSVQKDLQKTLDDIQTAGLYKRERLLDSPRHRMCSVAKRISSIFAPTTTSG